MKTSLRKLGPLVLLTSVLLSTNLLTACAPVLFGGTILLATDRRTAATQLEDQSIEFKALNQVSNTYKTAHFSVTSYNRVVLVTGEVASEAEKAGIEKMIKGLETVRSVINDLAVMPVSSLGSRSNDTLITSKVKASLIDAKDLLSGAYVVSTERGTVYLMGRVTQREANRGAEVAQGIPGVKKVVKLFEIISEDEYRRLVPPAEK
jgi:osmotically-inducible protein OsmY